MGIRTCKHPLFGYSSGVSRGVGLVGQWVSDLLEIQAVQLKQEARIDPGPPASAEAAAGGRRQIRM